MTTKSESIREAEEILHATITPYVDDEDQDMIRVEWNGLTEHVNPDRLQHLLDMVTSHAAPGPFYGDEEALFNHAWAHKYDEPRKRED